MDEDAESRRLWVANICCGQTAPDNSPTVFRRFMFKPSFLSCHPRVGQEKRRVAPNRRENGGIVCWEHVPA
jgi:hypothetical protein